MKINTCTLQTLAAVNRFSPETHGDHRALETIDDLIVPLVMHGVNHELIAFLHMSQVIRICPMARAFSLHMQLDNPFHGYVLWYLVLDYLCYCAKTFSFPIPGLSTTDAVGTGLSSCDKVMIPEPRRRPRWLPQCNPKVSLNQTLTTGSIDSRARRP